MADTPKTMSGRIRSAVKPYADQVGIGDFLRQSWVESHRLGEYIRRTAGCRPAPQDAVLLAGSGRSGTTWLTDILTTGTRIQQIFEPLIPLWNEKVRKLTGWDRSAPYCRSWYLPPDNSQPEWAELLQQVLTGRYRNYWTDYYRTCFFPDRFLIKEIRANLMLGYIADRFQPKIIYVIRHPCAVVESRLAVGWHADVADILSQERLLQDHLADWASEIAKEHDLLGAHAVWWAVENYVAMQDLASHPHCLVTYEDLCRDPGPHLAAIFYFLNISKTNVSEELLKTPGRMSRRSSCKSDSGGPEKWKRNLPVTDQYRILQWAERFGFQYSN